MTIYQRCSRPQRTVVRMSDVPECDKALESLPPGTSPPLDPERDSMHAADDAAGDKSTARRPGTEQQIDRRKNCRRLTESQIWVAT